MSLLITNLTCNEYKNLIATAVKKNIEDKLGKHAFQTINIYLKRYNLNLYDIFEEPNKIREMLYNMFGIAAYRVEYDIVRCIYEKLELKMISIVNLTHAINIAKVYYKLIHNGNTEIDKYIDLTNIEKESHCCKCCNKSFSISDPYDGLISELCKECYYTYNQICQDSL